MMLSFFFFNDTATTEIYTLSLHDALPICVRPAPADRRHHPTQPVRHGGSTHARIDTVSSVRSASASSPSIRTDRKSTRLNSSHANISYAVFCLKKKIHNSCYERHISSASY